MDLAAIPLLLVENGKPAAASELKTGERTTVNYAPHAEQRVAIRIAISPGARRLVLTRLRSTLTLRRGDRRGPGGCRSASVALNESARGKANHDD